MQPDIAQWEIISAGEQHADLNIGNGMIIKSRGKMSLEDYAAELKESAVGFSLMISPHPSYPPLEMAHFGMLVLTNSYENKNLSKLHGNIFSLEDISPDNMAKELKRLCDLFAQNKLIGEAEEIGFYLDDQQQFGFIEQLLSSL